MKTEYPIAVRVGVGVCCVLALWGALAYVDFENDYQQQSRDPFMVAPQSARLEALRAALPDSAVLGYVTDAAPDSVTAQTMFNAARYALAPRMIIQGANHDAVLGNFARPADYAAYASQRGLRVARDFGNGVVLFRKGDR
jgi:hypothetical protein